MSRIKTKQQRLNLFNRGNTRCPICLASFTKSEALAGKSVTLEHVPPKSFQREFGIRSMAACLTCADCNNSAGRQADQLALKALQTPKVRITIQGIPHAGSLTVGQDGVLQFEMTSRLRDAKIDYFNLEAKDYEFSITMPDPNYARASWLKSSYLSVFSLLGKHGYRYAEGSATCKVREQIMNPGKEIIQHPFLGNIPDQGDDWIGIQREPPGPCWMVKLGDWVIMLPASWDTFFYDGPIQDGQKFSIDLSCYWKRVKFAEGPVTSVSFGDETPLETILGKNSLGVTVRSVHEDNTPLRYYALADFLGRDITLLPVKAPDPDSGPDSQSVNANF